MSRVQCLECGIAVVVDPSGLCPEGHIVGSAGARIENAMGMAAPHPDEPEPWVATIELDQSDEPHAKATPVRAVRPVQIADADETAGGQVAGGAAAASDHEALLRELHALGDFDGSPATSPVPSHRTPSAPPVVAGSPAGSTAQEAPSVDLPQRETVAPVHQVTRDEMAEGFAELSALEAAVQALEFEHARDEPTAARGTEVPATDVGSELDDLSALFAAEVAVPAPVPAPVEATVEDARPNPGPDAVAHHDGGRRSGSDALDTPTAAAIPTADDMSPAPSDAPVREPARQLDFANFTAKGGTVGAGRGGGRRKLFGR